MKLMYRLQRKLDNTVYDVLCLQIMFAMNGVFRENDNK